MVKISVLFIPHIIPIHYIFAKKYADRHGRLLWETSFILMPMLRKVRITIAVLFFILITLLLLDFSGTIHTGFGWMAEVQFLPALLAVNVGVVALLVLLTLLFGRVYCSVVCPLGVFQDIISYFSGKKTKKQVQLFVCLFVVTLRHVGVVCRCFVGGGWICCRLACSL